MNTKKSLTKLRLPKKVNNQSRMLSTTALIAIERRYQAVELRRDGYSIRQIAQTLGCGMPAVSEALAVVLRQAVEDYGQTTEGERQLQIERLDLLLRTYKPYATESHKETRIDPFTNQEFIVEVPPDPKYAALILQIEGRRAKLLALDVPEIKRVEHTGIREYIGIDVEQV